MESNGELDRMLDAALASYSSAEPLTGLEERVLRRVRAGEAPRRRPLRWAFAFLAAAALVLLAIVIRTPRYQAPKANNTAHVEIPAAVPPRVAVEIPRVASKLRRGRTARRAPSPLSAEEQALRSFVERYPEAPQLFAQLQKRSNEPIQIEPIQIAPLEINGAP